MGMSNQNQKSSCLFRERGAWDIKSLSVRNRNRGALQKGTEKKGGRGAFCHWRCVSGKEEKGDRSRESSFVIRTAGGRRGGTIRRNVKGEKDSGQ